MRTKKTENIFKISLFIPLLIYFGKRSLIAFDEGFYVLQAKYILENSNWIGPTFLNSLSNDRTIGIQFLLALSRNIFGESLFALYLPILLASILMIYSTYYLHKELFNDKNPIYSALILATSFLWISFSNMATQDIVFASLISFGILSSIKAFKTNKNSYLIFSGIWIGLAFMLKTFLTLVPFAALFPFLLRNKIIYKKYFWIGFTIGFSPFIIWSYKYIAIYSFSTYAGIFRKFVILSKNNTFTQAPYYYLWNLSVNFLPWTILSIIGFIQASKMKSLNKYFLFFYPFVTITLLSLFSTKTPYYPLQIFSIISLNTYLGMKYLILKNDSKLMFFLEKLNYFFFPFIIILTVILINFNEIIDIDTRAKVFLSSGGIIFGLSWIFYNFVNNDKKKLFLSILGPYILIISLVQSGLITDKSKSLRIESEALIKAERLQNKPIYILNSEKMDAISMSKIIKIMNQMPKLAVGIENLNQLNNNSYIWTTSSNYNNEFFVVNDNKIFHPWKLIYKK